MQPTYLLLARGFFLHAIPVLLLWQRGAFNLGIGALSKMNARKKYYLE